jgi:hypothetical protein
VVNSPLSNQLHIVSFNPRVTIYIHDDCTKWHKAHHRLAGDPLQPRLPQAIGTPYHQERQGR